MDDVAASVGFAGWAFAAMFDHALFCEGFFIGGGHSDFGISARYFDVSI
jgi:hypothetical protein